MIVYFSQNDATKWRRCPNTTKSSSCQSSYQSNTYVNVKAHLNRCDGRTRLFSLSSQWYLFTVFVSSARRYFRAPRVNPSVTYKRIIYSFVLLNAIFREYRRGSWYYAVALPYRRNTRARDVFNTAERFDGPASFPTVGRVGGGVRGKDDVFTSCTPGSPWPRFFYVFMLFLFFFKSLQIFLALIAS